MSRKINVVLVDDSRSALKHQQELLSEFDGVNVVGTAADGAEAIRVVSQCRPDLVMMDIVMPIMDGLAALRLMKMQFPKLRVAMVSSAGGSASRAEEAFRLGASQVLCKPVDANQIAAVISRERELLESVEGIR